MLQSSDRLDVCCCVLSALQSPEKLFYVCCVCIQEQDFNNYENDTKKLGKIDRFVS